MNIFNRLLADVKGAVALEFSLVSIPFFALVLCAIQAFVVFFFEQTLQVAASQAARQLMVGQSQTQGLSQDQFKSLVCSNLPTVFDCGNVMVDVQTAGSYATLNTAPIVLTYGPNGVITNVWSYDPGAAGSVVIVRVLYNWPIVGGKFTQSFSNQINGSILMVGTAVVKNEPFS